MNVGRLILGEIAHRRLAFTLGVLAVLAAVGCLTATLTLLEEHDRRADQLLAERATETRLRLADHDRRAEQELITTEAATRKRLAELQDDYRKIALELGFNLLILPKDQNLGDLYADDFASKTMPEDYALRLAKAKVLTVNHLLPTLQQKIQWPEQANRTIVLTGVRGEVYILSKKQKPLLDAVPAGGIVLGHELHRALRLNQGDRVPLLGREFKVVQVNEERGNRDDITVWIPLADAQALLVKPGKINGILALECGCEADRIAKVRAEIGALLPDTQVIEFKTQAVTRAEARNRAEREAREALAAEKARQTRLRQERVRAERQALAAERQTQGELRDAREALAAVLVPVVLCASAAAVALLTFLNVRQRRGEIGILRALGVGSRQILTLFLGRAALTGFCGAALGVLAGLTAALLLGGGRVDPLLSALVVPAAVVVAALAAWLPALAAARQDPAVTLRDE